MKRATEPIANPAIGQPELQYVSLDIDGRTYGGWYRLLEDGRMELLALATMHSELRAESTPLDQARGMLTDFIRSSAVPRTQAQPESDAHRLYSEIGAPCARMTSAGDGVR